MIVDAPSPSVTAGSLLIESCVSLISPGTERMLVEFGKAGLVAKARQQPDKVRQVLDKARTDGVAATLDAVRSKLAAPLPLGYCNVGRVLEVGEGVQGIRVGDRVVSNGPHADIVHVPRNLCARIPDSVGDEAAAFTVVASIGLQGIRLAGPTLGEFFVVTGCGLIGLLTVQLLVAQGCQVLAIDYDGNKLALARQFGAEICDLSAGQDPVATGMAFSRGRGVDGVIITASTRSSDPVAQAAQMSRVRGRIILVGVTGLELKRADFYEKELTFQVSCSYGPGRYDPQYEERGQDYPFGHVRWTEQRNFEAVLDMLRAERLDVRPLLSARYAFEDAAQAYADLTQDASGLGLLLQYSSPREHRVVSKIELSGASRYRRDSPVLGVVGAGNYASRILIPAFKAAGAQLHTLVTAGGVSGAVHGEKAGFQFASTQLEDVVRNDEINTVVIATRHDSHAELVARALDAGKHVFVEKPLCIDQTGLDSVRRSYAQARSEGACQLMVGFNRRFAPHVQKMKQLLDGVSEPKSFIATVNAGAIPATHWTQDRSVGGGRIIGEACHFIDLLRYLAGAPIVRMQASCMGQVEAVPVADDKASITMVFGDGSLGTIHYFANGCGGFPKERIEAFAAGRILQLDNFKSLRGYGWKGFRQQKGWRQDKGQEAGVRAFLDALRSGDPAISADEIFEVSEMTLRAAEMLRAPSP